MSHRRVDSRVPADRPHVTSPKRPRARIAPRFLVQVVLLALLLLGEILGNWSFLALPANAASTGVRPSAPASMTFAQFLKEGRQDQVYHGPLIRPQHGPTLPGTTPTHAGSMANLPPSVEPPTMQPIAQPLGTSFLQGSAGVKPLDLRGSDGRLEVQVPPGAFDLSQATVSGGKAPSGTLTLRVSQVSGHFAGMLSTLGTYQLQLVDGQGQVVSGLRVRTPLTIIYHYLPIELASLGLDPGHVQLSWPQLLLAARHAHRPTTGLAVPLHNDPQAHTLTATSTIAGPGPFSLSGNPTAQPPSTNHLAAVQGNAGQLTYGSPLQVPPGTGGFTPQLALNYSSSDPNNRHSLTAPANNVGDGWTLSLGSISTEVYPDGTTWYFLSGIANAGDRLVYNSTTGLYETEHLSYLRIQQLTVNGQPCFGIWDKAGTYYTAGCSTDSLQYRTDSSGTRTNYRWDVNQIVAPNEGPNSTSYKKIIITYLQDSVTSGSYTTIRDAAIQQLTYGITDRPGNPLTTVAGTIDFHYKAPTAHGNWADAYGTNYNCTGTPPDGTSTTWRCDDPIQKSGSGTFTAPTVLSTLSLQTVTSYVGTDGSATNTAYRYSFTYSDTPYVNCTDPTSGQAGYCAGEHVLMSVTPTVYQSGTTHQLKGVVFGYTDPADPNTHDTYSDLSQTVNGQPYRVTTTWKYLNSYVDTNSGVGGHISYYVAYNNTHGTPTQKDGQGNILDNRYDPFYCPNHANDADLTLRCTGNYANPDDHAWSEQVVTQLKAWGQDSSSSSLQPADTLYSYRLTKTGTWGGTGHTYCYPDQYNQDQDCVGDDWIPPNDTDWQDYYHSEYQGFNQVYITSPANDLTVQTYYSTEGWNSAWSDPSNFLGGSLQEEDVYSGNQATASALLRKTVNTYATSPDPCRSTTATYPVCEIVLQQSTASDANQTGSSSPPSLTTSDTYDDYTTSGGLAVAGSKVYHNLTQEQISGTNLPSSLYPVTRKWTYTTNDQAPSGWTYYTVDTVTHREVDDASAHIWQCQDTTYDQNSGNTSPTAGWPTTVKTYTNCADVNTALTSYADYDVNGNVVAAVDGVGTANPSFYSSKGCTVPSGTIVVDNTAWTAGRYTACTAYDAAHYAALPTSTTNALGQTASTGYDTTQGDVPTSTTDANNQSTSYTYSYDASGNQTVQGTQPLHSGSYTTQSKTNSGCTTSSTLPCFEIDTNSNQYSSAITRTFSDSLGRKVETRTPGPGAGHDTIVFTVYNDQAHTSFQSVPFQVASGSSWVDPNGATDYNGTAPGGTVTFSDALGRAIAVQDPLFGQGQDGITCSATLTGTYTACTNYSLGTVSGDSNTYISVTGVDPNKHVGAAFLDELGRTIYTQQDSGLYGGTPTANQQTTTAYTALDAPTSVQAKDLSPQTGQSLTSVTTTAQYDDLGRVTQLSDPDRGTHYYTYDADGRLLSDVVGTHTLGYNDDLLGRVGCVQNAVPTLNATGACSAGSPYVQNTYDTTELGTQGSTDFPVGRLTQSVATTSFPEGTSATATEKMQHDQRGRTVTGQLSLGLPGAWNVTTALPTYQMAVSYNDADQVTTTTTSTIPTGQGYTTTVAYDSTGALSGLSNNTSSTPNLATLVYNARAQLDTINFQTNSGNALASEQFSYDANLRSTSTNAIWLSNSGNMGTIFSQTRSYDPASNLISLSTTQATVSGQGSSGGSETQNFCYDEQNRQVWAGNSGTQPGAGNGTCGSGTLSSGLSGASYATSYVYTHLGQLWQGPLNGGSTQYQYLYCNSQPHELTGLYQAGSTCASKSGQGYASSYDAFGNVTSRTFSGTTGTLSYDNLDQFTEWNAGSSNQEWYLYDASGQRVLRRSTTGSGTTLTVYAFGLEEHVYSSSGTNQWNTYYYSLGGHLLGSLDANGMRFYFTDALGSVLSNITNATGGALVKGNQVFGPYGNGRYFKGDINTAKGFTGQYNDGLTGLDYYNARYYDPKVGVFLSADTVQGNGSGENPYAYVGGNPETFSDPTGEIGAPIYQLYHGRPGSSMPTPGWAVAIFAIIALPIEIPVAIDAGALVAAGGIIAGSIAVGVGIGYLITQITHRVTSTTSTGAATGTFSGAGATAGAGGGVVGGGSGAGTASGAGNAATAVIGNTAVAAAGGTGCSFTADTHVATDHGEKAIGSLHVGDKVQAYNPKTHKMEQQSILHVWKNTDSDLVDLTITFRGQTQSGKSAQQQYEVIHTTSKHPFMTTEQGFVPAGKLKVGMHVLRADGSAGVVTEWKVVHSTKLMYNLEVAKDHTFVVGEGKWVVHNDCSNKDRARLRRSLRNQQGLRYGQEAHHIIPCEFQQDPLVTRAAEDGFKFNSYANGIGLPTDLTSSVLNDLPYHEGSHGAYSQKVGQMLYEAYQELSETYGNFANVPASVARKAVEDIISSVRDTIMNAGGGCSINEIF